MKTILSLFLLTSSLLYGDTIANGTWGNVRIVPPTYANVTSGLVGWWKMDEGTGTTFANAAGTNNGALTGSPVWTNGIIGSALSCNGSSSGAYVPDSNAEDFGTNSLSCSFWVSTRTTVGGQVIGKRGSSPSGNASFDCWAFYVTTSGTINAGFRYTASLDTDTLSTSTVTITNGAWHHICGTWDRSGNVTLYVDGSVSGTPASIAYASAANINFTQPTTFGYRQTGSGTKDIWFNGTVDEVRIYNRALSASEVQQIYNWRP